MNTTFVVFIPRCRTFPFSCSRVKVARASQKNQTNSAVKPLPQKKERLEPFQISVEQSRRYIFVDKTGLGHQHGVEGRLKSGSLKLGAKEDADEMVFDMNSFDADTDAARRTALNRFGRLWEPWELRTN